MSVRKFDVASVRADFPALAQKIHGKRFVYLDSAATALKPQVVVDRLADYYRLETANIHRGSYYLADQGTSNYELARKAVADFIGASSEQSIVFTSGTTDSFNLIADSFVRKFLSPGDEILISDIEHHANIVPWQLAGDRYGVKLRGFSSDSEGRLSAESLQSAISERTKLVSISHASNALGVIQPVKELTEVAHSMGAKVAVDGAQIVAYRPVDVEALGVDFYAFSAHKLFAPFGTGVLYGKKEILSEMPPFRGGGSMINNVDIENGTTYNEIPFRFEAGTPNVGGVLGLHRAIQYLSEFDFSEIMSHEESLLKRAVSKVSELGGVQILRSPHDTVPVLSFNVQGVHHSDIGTLLDQQGIAVRVGHHCAQPLMKKYNIEGTVRASFSLFNDEEDVDQFVASLEKAKEMLL